MGDAKAAKRPRLDTTRLDSEVWMLKCPQFISQSWTSIDLLQEKDAVRRTDAAQEFVAVTQTFAGHALAHSRQPTRRAPARCLCC